MHDERTETNMLSIGTDFMVEEYIPSSQVNTVCDPIKPCTLDTKGESNFSPEAVKLDLELQYKTR